MTVTVIGAGYVGLVTAAIFSEFGNTVYCVDVIEEKIQGLKKGIVPFFELSLPEYIQRNVEKERLFFTTDYKNAVLNSEIIFICVGTPPTNDGEADLTYLFSAVEEAAKNIKDYALIVIKSTVPVGFEDDLEKIVKKHAKGPFEFASCPEFLREGTAIEDTLNPDRVVIGTTSQKAQKLLLELHAPIPGERIICDMRSAQLIKYAANSLLATKVSFANAIAILCEKMGADVEKVMAGVGADKRIGRQFLDPGLGYGGSCLPKDVLAFIAIAKHFDYDFDLLRSVDSINAGQVIFFVNKIRNELGVSEQSGKNLENKNIAILGLAFKPNTDDIREAPSLKIINHLKQLGANITAYDPQAINNTKKIIPDIEYANNVYSAIENKDAVVIITEWAEFKEMDLTKVKSLLKTPVIIDGRNIFDPRKMKELGFTYSSIGR